ncbi:MAG: exo-alpha-sialidase [Myxococcota bacterium]
MEKVASRWTITSADFLGDPVTMCFADRRSGMEFAALRHGHFGAKLHRRGPGEAWREVTAPAYPPKPEGKKDVDPNDKTRDIPWTLDTIWALEAGRDPGELWLGSLPGGLFHTRDHGDSWALVEGLWNMPERSQWMGGGADLPGLHSIVVDPRDGDSVLIGVSSGGAWRTRDRGRTWSVAAHGMRAAFMPPERALDPLIQDPHAIAQSPSRPERLWCQHHNGIFRSDDGGQRWVEIEEVQPSVFGFAVAVHPTDPDTAWFVPGHSDQKRIPLDGKVVVTRTRDGGKSFQTLREGLPQEHAYDLTLRHALAVDPSGQVLAFGTTTGALFVTEDGGDHWREVTAHLPPVYVVRIDT